MGMFYLILNFVQYPRGLGNTVEELNLSDKCVKFEKTKFSMLVPNVKKHLQNFPQAKSVILFGIEASIFVFMHADLQDFKYLYDLCQNVARRNWQRNEERLEVPYFCDGHLVRSAIWFARPLVRHLSWFHYCVLE